MSRANIDEIMRHRIERCEGDQYLINLYEGCNLFIGPSKSGKTYLCQKQIMKSWWLNCNGRQVPRYVNVIVVTMNAGTGDGWRRFFAEQLNRQIQVLNMDELTEYYKTASERFVECKKKYGYGPNHLIVFDDTSSIENPSLVEQRRVKNNPTVSDLAKHGRNLAMTICALFQDFVDVPSACFTNSFYVAMAYVKNIRTRRDHAYPKVLYACTKSLPWLVGAPDHVINQFFNREMQNMKHHEFFVRYEYPAIEGGQEVMKESIILYTASPPH